ncbi:MAG: hypothetical protein NT068_01015 [Candidatus Nomurabacteria bacterium]|nr:hypothetical protein [Candidatus Nomurabacteria bacterium]
MKKVIFTLFSLICINCEAQKTEHKLPIEGICDGICGMAGLFLKKRLGCILLF